MTIQRRSRNVFDRLRLVVRWSVVVSLLVALPRLVLAQMPVVGVGAIGGVAVDPQGMLRDLAKVTKDGDLEKLRDAPALDVADADVAKESRLRKISLGRLEQLVAALHAEGKALPLDVRLLAGLQSVRYVFFYPEQGEVVLAGPAEGWKRLATGEVVGTRSGRPVLHLDDWLVALRFAFGQNQGDGFLGCSIEPTEPGAKKLADYFRRLRSGLDGADADPARRDEIFAGMERALGPQDIKLYGVPGQSRFAIAMVSADYRLKRIALGHDPSPVKKVVSYLDLAARSGQSSSRSQVQHRWWFVADFDAVRHTEDKTAFGWEGDGMKVLTAPTARNFRPAAGAASKPARAATQFAQSFTKHLPELAAQVPVFAELENLIGLSLAAEVVKRRGDEFAAAARDNAMWRPTHWLDRNACPIEEYPVPTQTAALANYRHIEGSHWTISVSGGVEISPTELVKRLKLDETPHQPLSAARKEARLPADEKVWWWD